MDFRRKANRWVTKTKGKPSQPERSGGLFLNMAPRKVASRGGAAKSCPASSSLPTFFEGGVVTSKREDEGFESAPDGLP
ncbi:MAG: hypothetical protein WKF77_18460, partial [Planctomycetaceae bacterium]